MRLRTPSAQGIKSQHILSERLLVASLSPKYKTHIKRLLSAASLSVVAAFAVAAQEIDAEKIDLAADQLTYDADKGLIRAVGRVLLRREGYTLEAAEITYNENTGEAIATGAVLLTTPNGDRIFSPRFKLQDTLEKAFVEDVRLLMADGAQVRALTGERDEETGNMSLDRAVYSPCKVCAEDGETQPLWQIKAVKVVHDKEKRRLYYEDAVLEVFGLPVMWTPFFSHPDPTVEKASGILPLDIQTTKNLGFYAAVPYYHVFDDSKDITVTPTITTKEGLLLSSEYRQHIGMGQFQFGGSITYTDERDTQNMKTGSKEFRGHIESFGQFNHAEQWRSTYKLNWASDDTYLRRYDFSDTDTLMSEYLLEGFFGRSYVSARTMAFQGLRIEDKAGQTAYALPLIDAEFIPRFKPLGGTISLRGNALALHRTSGLDTQRLSLSANWRKRWIAPNGLVVDADLLARSDLYNINDVNLADESEFAGSFGASSSGSEWRNLARATAAVSWPLVKFSENTTQTLEPILEVTASPRNGTPDDIVNEDSRAFELNDLNLFSPERAAGFDLWEEGSRLTYGLRWRYEQGKFSSDILVGQTWRISAAQNVLADGAGLEGDFSDIVGRTVMSYDGWIDLEHRYRLDDKSFKFLRNEVDVTFGDETKSLRIGYFNLKRDLALSNREDREEIRMAGHYFFAQNWKVSGTYSRRLDGAIRDEQDEGVGNIRHSIGVAYTNDCIELGLTWRETFTEDRDVEPGTSILFQIKLKNLG
jgi:LPS-assembly protein